MKVNSDFRDLLKTLNEFGVRYLVVGGYAVMIHTEPYYTKDLDLWVEPVRENAERVRSALARFGAPLSKMTVEDFTDTTLVYQIGVDPVRIDILMSIPGVTFEEAWANHIEVKFDDEPGHVISREHLVVSKRAAGRPRDLRDLRHLLRKQKPG